MSTFGERLRLLRLGRKLRQEDLAKKIKISKSAVGMYERNDREPNFELLQKIADFFEVSIDYLIGKTENPILKGSPSPLTKENIKSKLNQWKEIAKRNGTIKYDDELSFTYEDLVWLESFIDITLDKKRQNN